MYCTREERTSDCLDLDCFRLVVVPLRTDLVKPRSRAGPFGTAVVRVLSFQLGVVGGLGLGLGVLVLGGNIGAVV